MRELALFAGAGGGILGGKLLGWRTVCAVERDAYAAQILAQRQNDGILEPFPIWSDVCSFDGKAWRGIVDVVSGGFPCQDISAAGKGAGIEGERSGMWKEMARIIGEVRPKYAFVENSPMLTTRGLGVVLADLAALGFDAEWGVLSAADVGANHKRERIWILGYANNHGQITAEIDRGNTERSDCSKTRQEQASESTRPSEQYAELANAEKLQRNGSAIHGEHGKSEISEFGNCGCTKIRNTNSQDVERQRQFTIRIESQLGNFSDASGWSTEPNVGRVANGVAFRVDRLKAIGNGQVPLCAATAFELLRARFDE